MLRFYFKVLLGSALAAGGAAGVYVYQNRTSPQVQIQQLQEEKKQLQQFVDRLSNEKRVAEVVVTGQKVVNGVTQTTLLFEEYGRDGLTLPPRTFIIDGASAHIDAMVIKFDHDFIARNDPLRGHSIALFCRFYGDSQSPQNAARIDEPGVIPGVYRAEPQEPPKAAEFERELWQNFWKLADDPAYRAQKGVRVATGQGVWGPFVPGRLYTVTLETDGGLNLTSEPIKGILAEMLKHHDTD